MPSQPVSCSLIVVAHGQQPADLAALLEQLGGLDYRRLGIVVVVAPDDPAARSTAEQAARRFGARITVVTDHQDPRNPATCIDSALPACQGELTGLVGATTVHPQLLDRVAGYVRDHGATQIRIGAQLQSPWWSSDPVPGRFQLRLVPGPDQLVFARTELLATPTRNHQHPTSPPIGRGRAGPARPRRDRKQRSTHMRRRSLALLAALAGAMTLTVPVQAASTHPVAIWQLNEPATAKTMTDTSGNQINGTIGAHVRPGTRLPGGGTGYRFPYRQPNTPPADPQHLVVVPHHPRLNPGTGAFAVQVRLRTSHAFGNLIQKGQSASPGGYWKFEQPNGKIACLFRGSAGTSTATSGTVRVNDGRWHTVRCERTPTSVTMTVDGQVTGHNTNPTGTIANTKPLTIAGKLNCDQINPTCDYFTGDIDHIKIHKS